jgi:hypothetical protein
MGAGFDLEVRFDGLDGLPNDWVALLIQSDGLTIESSSKKEKSRVDRLFTGTVTDITFRVLIDVGLRFRGHDNEAYHISTVFFNLRSRDSSV